MTTPTEQNARSGYIAGLRRIADALETDPTLDLPYHGSDTHFSVFCRDKAEFVAWSRVLTGKADKKVDEDASYGFQLDGHIEGVQTLLYVHRDEVCERVVTGTREVTKEIPDPEALAAVPTVTVTETVEDVEWVCTPLLADRPAS